MPFHIILVHPEIPQNTGSIGRLCVSTGSTLHLVHPLGFDTSDYYLRRAGLDYWERLNPTHYQDWEDFLARNPAGRLSPREAEVAALLSGGSSTAEIASRLQISRLTVYKHIENIFVAWILTIPCSFLIAAGVLKLIHPLF